MTILLCGKGGDGIIEAWSLETLLELVSRPEPTPTPMLEKVSYVKDVVIVDLVDMSIYSKRGFRETLIHGIVPLDNGLIVDIASTM